MSDNLLKLDNLDNLFPEGFTEEQIAKGKTAYLKELSLHLHQFYGGKMCTIPKAGIYGFNWFNIWYTPGVSKISTTIRDNPDTSFNLSNRGNLVAVVSDSTRVLGDGDCGPSGGLGVMEGKVFLMKYLGSCDGISLCINSYNDKGEHDPDKIIEFVKMLEPSVGAINLEDISQPNCYKVLDTLQKECNIPVWHDDAQGTGCVTLAGLINALKIASKDLSKVRMVFLGAGASNTTIVRLILKAGGNPENIIVLDSKGGLHKGRDDIKADQRFYRKWEICESTNPKKIRTMEEAMIGADVLIALSKPGPDTVKPEWIRLMNKKAIVFVCANPVPEIYPFAAREAGAYIVATGRGDFPNQVNNSLGFPGILKGSLMVRAKKITDNMAIAAANSIADTAESIGLSPDFIVPKMDNPKLFPTEATEVALAAIKDGVARIELTKEELYNTALKDITESRSLIDHLMENNYVPKPPISILEDALKVAIDAVK